MKLHLVNLPYDRMDAVANELGFQYDVAEMLITNHFFYEFAD